MSGINIGKKLMEKRKQKGVTQDELALYIGVTKASVSKWETGQSYPDITFLPELATYFNITVDELIGYSPQMTKEDIKRLYLSLSEEFSNECFENVYKKSQDIIKKYYSCFPLLFEMAVLLVNHHMLAKEKDRQEEILREAMTLCLHIKEDSSDMWLSKMANSLEAACYIILQKPQEVLELLEGIMKPTSEDEVILATAYQMTGNMQKAKEVLQISSYKHILGIVGSATSLLSIYVTESGKFEELIHRVLAISDLFNLDKLHASSMVQFYLAAAQGYLMQGDSSRALDMLKIYADICATDFFPVTLHGDEFFDCIDNWFKEFSLDIKAPRDEKVIKESMVQAITENPIFASLIEEPRYKNIVNTLKLKLGVK